MAEYLTNTADLTAVADAIRAKGGTSAPLVYPSGFVSAIQSIDVAGGAAPATLIITSSDYTGNYNGNFILPTLEGHLQQLTYDFPNNDFTFPITIETVLGGLVAFAPDGFSGIPNYKNHIGCEVTKFKGIFYILVTSPQASIQLVNADK
jgi:hypothetical protein